MTPSNHFSQYLLALRQSRGIERISEYAAMFRLPVTDAYYRDLEAGKALISLEKAEQLCQSLKADTGSFYRALLHDTLPLPAAEALLSTEYVQPRLPKTIKKLSDKTINVFKATAGLMNIIAFIYSHDEFGVSVARLQEFLKAHKTHLSTEETINLFCDLDLIKETGSRDNDNHRVHKTATLLDWNDPFLEQLFLLEQVDRYFQSDPAIVPNQSTHYYAFTAFMPVEKESVAEILTAIDQAIDQLDEFSEEDDAAGEMTPFSISAIVRCPDQY